MAGQFENYVRELDKIIAVEIFQWKCQYHCDGIQLTECNTCGKEGHGHCYGDGSCQTRVLCDHWGRFSSDMNLAMSVVRALRPNNHFGFDTQSLADGNGGWLEGWQVSFGRKDKNWTYMGQSVRPEVAICINALQAIDYPHTKIMELCKNLTEMGISTNIHE